MQIRWGRLSVVAVGVGFAAILWRGGGETEAPVGDEVELVRLPGEERGDLVTQVIPLQRTRAEDMAKTLEHLMSGRGKVTVNSSANTLILTATPESVRELHALALSIDVGSEQPTAKRYPLRHADPLDARHVIEGLYMGGDQALLSRVVGDAASRSLYVLAGEEGHEKVAALLAEIDEVR